jgi:hypothetical protein
MKLLVITVLMTLSLMSCVSSSDQVFSDPNLPSEDSVSIRSLAVGIESGMRNELGIYIRDVSSFAREAYYFEPSDPRYTGELLIGPIDPGGFLLTRPWSARYRVVKNCNVMIARAADVPASGDANSAAGFAKTILAHQLLLNLCLTDSNGIRVDVDDEPLGPIVGKNEALAAIAAMLDEGSSNLNNGGSSFQFSLSSGFAGFDSPATFNRFNRAIRARVAAYQEDWNGVMSALANSFIDAGGSMNTGVYHIWSGASGDLLNPVFEEPQADAIKFHGHPSFETDAEAGDLRYSGKVAKRAPRTFDNLTSDLAVTVSKGNADPFPIIRNEELLLLRAEANIHLGALNDAEDDINVVRAAAGLGEVVLSNVDDAIDQMLHERRYSLAFEGHRWVDLRRYGRLGTLPLDRAGDNVVTQMPIPANENQ